MWLRPCKKCLYRHGSRQSSVPQSPPIVFSCKQTGLPPRSDSKKTSSFLRFSGSSRNRQTAESETSISRHSGHLSILHFAWTPSRSLPPLLFSRRRFSRAKAVRVSPIEVSFSETCTESSDISSAHRHLSTSDHKQRLVSWYPMETSGVSKRHGG